MVIGKERYGLTTSPRVLLASQNIRARKALGQHFLNDRETADRIVSLSEIDSGDTVVEIGSGLGALTLPVSERARHVAAVETDRRIMALLKAEVAASKLQNVEFIEEDILKVDLKRFIPSAGDRLVVIGNLPYNISTPILAMLVNSRRIVSRAVLMLQKEVAERMAAPPGKKARGRLSVLVQYGANVENLLDVPASLFFPRPKVDSRVVKITFNEKHRLLPDVEKRFFKIVEAAFGKRRKTLKNALAGGGLGLDATAAEQVLNRAEIDPMRRAETLSVTEFLRLCDAMEIFR